MKKLLVAIFCFVAMSLSAQTWQKVSIEEANLNPFTLFQNAAALTVGNEKGMNSMTIGWGQLGVLWGGDRHVITVYLRKSRFTKHLMDENDTFTVEAFPDEYAEKLQYLGTKSGRNEDKIKGAGLTVKTMENGAPAFEEGKLILECRKIYDIEYPVTRMPKDIADRWYGGKEKDNPSVAYVGEITAVWVKK